MLVIANNAARQGSATRLFPRVVSVLRERWRDLTFCAYWPPFDLGAAIRRELGSAAPRIIALGGDGTLNHVLNAVLRIVPGDASHVTLGAVGLGSSNDAVKPPTARIADCSARVEVAEARKIDLLRVTSRSVDGIWHTRHALANVGFGAIAEANRRFNAKRPGLRAMKKFSPPLAIHWCALRTIATWRGSRIRLRIDREPERAVTMDTLSALKTPWIAGSLHYDIVIERDDGRLGICLSAGVGRIGLLRLMRDLSRGRFQGGAGRQARIARSLQVRSEEPLAIECDGEVETCREARIEVLPRAIGWMG